MSLIQSASYYTKPQALFFATLCAVFVSEFLVMLLLPGLHDLPSLTAAFLDACLLSVVVVPFLYGFFLRPLQASIALREQTENEREQLREIDRLKSAFVAIAAHELNTPLTVIRGYAELLLMEKMFDGPERTNFAAIINEKTYAMERLISDLLDTNRAQSGRPLLICKESRNIVAALASALDDFRMQHPERPLAVNLPADAVCFPFDSVRLDQVLDHLLRNAVRFSPAESPIEVEAALRNGTFRVRIADHGIGMSPEEVRQVFDRFYRADMTDTSAAGLGLGMSLVKEIIDAHGGEIRLESRPGAGTTVYFTLPAGS